MDSLQWAVNGYFLTGSLIIVGGKLGDLIGRRKLFVIGSGLLIAGSVVAMFSTGVTQLVIGRLIEGVGAAAILRRSLLVYGAGGIVAPFVGIKLIDLALQALHLV